MTTTVRIIVIGLCLSLAALIVACGSKPAATASPTPSPAKTLTARQQAVAYFKVLKPIARADERFGKKLKQNPLTSYHNGFSAGASIDNSVLPAVERLRARLKAVTPPARFRVAHARLLKGYAIEIGFLYFMKDAIEQVVYTKTIPPGLDQKFSGYFARLKKVSREYNKALRAAAKESGVKVPKVLLAD